MYRIWTLGVALRDESRDEILAGLPAAVGNDASDVIRLLHARMGAVDLLVERGARVEAAHLAHRLLGNGVSLVGRQTDQVPDDLRGEQRGKRADHVDRPRGIDAREESIDVQLDGRPQRRQMRLQETAVDDSADSRMIGRVEEYQERHLLFGDFTQLFLLLVGRPCKRRVEDDGGMLLEQGRARQFVDPVVTEYGVNAVGRSYPIAIPVHLPQQGIGILQAFPIGHRLLQSGPYRLDIIGANARIHV
jgi:hypothetical protein